jgi:hypothetical protein
VCIGIAVVMAFVAFVGRAELDGLIAKGYLSPDKREDLHAIQLAIDDLMFDCFTGAFRCT